MSEQGRMSAEQTPDIERVLAEHALSYVAQIGNTWGWSCTCPSISKNADQKTKALAIASHARHVAQALTPVLAAAVREAKVELLREVANELRPGPTMRWLYERESCDWWGDRPVRDWLRDRADRVAEPQHEAATSGKESEAGDE